MRLGRESAETLAGWYVLLGPINITVDTGQCRMVENRVYSDFNPCKFTKSNKITFNNFEGFACI